MDRPNGDLREHLGLIRRRDDPSWGMTVVRGPYYSSVGVGTLVDTLESYAPFVDMLKFGGGSFLLWPDAAVTRVISRCHELGIEVSTGGVVEAILVRARHRLHDFFDLCKRLDFDVVEISRGFITLPRRDYLRLVEQATALGFKVKAEVGVQFGAGGASSVEELAAERHQDVENAARLALDALAAGAYKIMLESEGVTEQVTSWRTDVLATIADRVGLENLVFEAADPDVFVWLINTFGPDVNLFVDHTQIAQLAAVRSGLWGVKNNWSRIVRLP